MTKDILDIPVIQQKELINKDNIELAYGAGLDNWGDRLVFQGDYINLGHWDNIPLDKQLTPEDRVKSSANLYDCILKELSPAQSDVVLEIGCGRGCGILNTLEKYKVKKIIGIDVLPSQIARAKNNIANASKVITDNIELLVASADMTQQADQSIDKIFSVEIVQHFQTMIPFAKEIKRIIKPNGKIVFTAHLSTEMDSCQKMINEGLMIGEGIDVFLSIRQIIAEFEYLGFNPRYYSIGEQVFRGYDEWMSQTCTDYSWGHNIYKAYKKEYLDYFVIVIN